MPIITMEQAVEELGIDVPVMACRMVGNQLELRLYGGRVVFYPGEPIQQISKSANTQKDTPAGKARKGRPRKPAAPHPSPLPERAREKSEP